MSKTITLTTGILRREPETVSAVVNLSNLDRRSRYITVEVWDWSSYSNPTKLPVLIGNNLPIYFPYLLASNNLAVLYTDLSNVLFYEIRFIHRKERNIVTNAFGRNATLEAQPGNTVLDSQLTRIKPGN